MRIVDPRLAADLVSGRPVKLHLGGGSDIPAPGFYGVDVRSDAKAAAIADFNEPLELFPPDSVEEVHSEHTMEHVERFIPLLRELHRIVRRDGRIRFTVPHFSNPHYYSDPTHVRFFGLYTMYYFMDPERQPLDRKVPSFYADVRFDVLEVKMTLQPRALLDRILTPFLSRRMNRNPRTMERFERRLCWMFPADLITYVFRPVK